MPTATPNDITLHIRNSTILKKNLEIELLTKFYQVKGIYRRNKYIIGNGHGHLQLHFQKCKNKTFFSEALGWSKKSFVRRFENDTFESVFFKSVEIESVVVSAHPQRIETLKLSIC